MKKILEKLKKVLVELENEHGSILVFALFLREDSPARWDLVVSASWLDSGNVESYKIVATKTQNVLDTEELVQLSRVVILDVEDSVVSFLQNSYNVPNGTIREIDNCAPFTQKFNFTIQRAYLLRCIKKSS